MKKRTPKSAANFDFGSGVQRPADVFPEWRFGLRLRACHRLLTSEFQAQLDRHGIRVSEWAHLRVIADEEGLTQVEISRRLRIEKASSTIVFERLKKIGLIVGRTQNSDRRKIGIYLTPAGKRTVAKVIPDILSVINAATSSISDKKMNEFIETIRQITENLEVFAASRGMPFEER